VVHHLRRTREVLPRLDQFFAEHAQRWPEFADPTQQEFFRRLTVAGGEARWLRFTVVELDGRPIAHHFGFSHAGTYLFYKPSYAIEHAKHSPGTVLLRATLLAARAEGAASFDLGLGDEPYKARIATHVAEACTVGIYAEP
jgi:CelD/BcsL family acetyltransferase involved in cellulose biosynthesis